MKTYIFKLNDNSITLEELKNILQYEVDWCDLFTLGQINYDDVSGENTSDIISVEELEEPTLDDAIKVVEEMKIEKCSQFNNDVYHFDYIFEEVLTALKGLKEGKE